MTLKKLIDSVVAGLNREYLSPQEQAKISSFIIDNSTLSVSKTQISLESASLLGIGRDIIDKSIPDYSFITFFWGDLDPDDTQPSSGLPVREWSILSHRTLCSMEMLLIARADNDNNFTDGEMVALVDGKLANYEVKSEPLNTDASLNRQYIEWVDIEPYQINYIADTQHITEHYSSQYQTELRVLQLLRDKAKEIHVYESITERELHFSVTQNVYDTRPLPGDTDLNIMWHPWGMLDFNDFED